MEEGKHAGPKAERMIESSRQNGRAYKEEWNSLTEPITGSAKDLRQAFGSGALRTGTWQP